MQKVTPLLWIKASRLRTLPLALAGIITGSFMAAAQGAGSWTIFALCAITAVLFQVLSNLANDLGDGLRGTDEIRLGEKRMVGSGEISPKAMKRAVVVLSVFSAISSFTLIAIALHALPIIWSVSFIGLAIAAIIAARSYTLGSTPYGYHRLGEVMVFIFFGLVSVGGTYSLMTKTWDPTILIAGSAIGFFSAGVLHLNNLRDIPTDLKTNKKTLANWMGFRYAKVFQYILILLAFDAIFIYNWMTDSGWTRNLFILATPLILVHLVLVSKLNKPEEADPLLKHLAITTLIISLLWGFGHYLGR